MMVSVLVAESMIEQNRKKHKEGTLEMNELYNKTINSMKNNARLKGVLSLRKMLFDFGQPTTFFSNGIQLFTGDEVEFRSGKKGVVVKRGEHYYIYTNAETAELVSDARFLELERSFFVFGGCTTGDRITITKHFNELTLGEEIAKGRKGAKGFTVTEVWSEVNQ